MTYPEHVQPIDTVAYRAIDACRKSISLPIDEQERVRYEKQKGNIAAMYFDLMKIVQCLDLIRVHPYAGFSEIGELFDFLAFNV